MALRINHNIAALDAWRNLTNTTRKMSSTMEKLSSGFRVNRAADDPAGLVISEQFRAQIAGLNRAISNSEGSINMIQTAEGALNEINNLLVNMRELSIHAANEGFNDTNQLAADQAEISNAISTITRIAQTTQFGTKFLLDGSQSNTSGITSQNTALLTLSGSEMLEGNHNISATQLTDSTATIDNETLGLTDLTGPYNLSDGVHNIDVVQASSGAAKIGAAIDFRDAWGNTLSLNTAVTATEAKAKVIGSWDTNLWTTGTSATFTWNINYQEVGSNPVGMQTITFHLDDIGAATADMAGNIRAALQNAIAANAHLAGKVTASLETLVGNDNIAIKTVKNGAQYSLAIGDVSCTNSTISAALYSDLTGEMANVNHRGTSDSRFVLTALVSSYGNPNELKNAIAIDIASAATVTFTSLSNLVATLNASLTLAANFGTFDASVGAAARIQATVVSAGGQQKIKFFGLDEGSAFYIKLDAAPAAISTDATAYKVLGLSVDTSSNKGMDAQIRFDNYVNTVDEVRYGYNATYTNAISLYTSADTDTRGSVTFEKAMGYEGGINVGNMLMTVRARTYAVQLDGGTSTTVIAGQESRIYSSDRTQSIMVNYNLKSDGGTETIYTTDRSLVFQIGGNYGQTAKIGIDNLSAATLGRGTNNAMWSNLSEVDVMTAQGAQDALLVIDKAINDVTNIRGNLGSFQKNTLASNLTNLRIASQNLTAAESSIRDTDMASTMSSFVSQQILLQAGVAMLAQGNQIPQVVLSLFG